MHRLYQRASSLTGEVISGAIAVHRELGPGLLEGVYQRCLAHELQLRGLSCEQQRSVLIRYRDLCFEETLRCDLLIEDCLLVELKAVHEVAPIHKAQVISYMKLLEVPLGLLFNFHEWNLARGTHRLILPGAQGPPARGRPE